jgi:predicted acetyltransferase
MGQTPAASMTRLGVNYEGAPFKQVTSITEGSLELRLTEKYHTAAGIPCYEFLLLVDDQEAGVFRVRIEADLAKVRDHGNLDIEVHHSFRGQDLPVKATKAVLPFLASHGMAALMITCKSGNRAIHQACERLEADYLDTAETEASGVWVDRFLLKLKGSA